MELFLPGFFISIVATSVVVSLVMIYFPGGDPDGD